MEVRSDSPIVLQSARFPGEIDPKNIYFAFASGRFAYDCVACSAKCCRGFGYRVDVGRELAAQTRSHPAIEVFVDRVQEGVFNQVAVRNCPPECFFLNENGLCEVQVRDGFDAKPETCRLFPFNNIRRIANYLVIGPHPELCPISVLPSGSVSLMSSHPELIRQIGSTIGQELPPMKALSGAGGDHIALERAIVGLSEQCLETDSYVHFAVAQLTTTYDMLSHHLPVAGTPSTSRQLATFVELVGSIIGRQPSPQFVGDPDLIRNMVACTPFIRSLYVFGGNEPGRRQLFPLERLPHLLLALYVLCALAAEAGMRRITFQTIVRLYKDHQSLLELLAESDRPMTLRRDVMLEFPLARNEPTDLQVRYLRIVQALLRGRKASMPALLGDVLNDNLKDCGSHKMMVLRQIAARLAPSVVALHGKDLRQDRVTSLKPVIQHSLIGRLDGPVLAALLAVRHSRRRGQ